MSVYWMINYLANLEDDDRKKIKITVKKYSLKDIKKKKLATVKKKKKK